MLFAELHNCQLSLELIDKLKKKYSIKSESSFTDPPTLKHRPVHIQTAFPSSFQRHSQIPDNQVLKCSSKGSLHVELEFTGFVKLTSIENLADSSNNETELSLPLKSRTSVL